MKFVNRLTGKSQEPEPWQIELKPGDFYLNATPIGGILDSRGARLFDGMPNIYGEILRPAYAPGFFFVRGYSKWCPGGEDGLLCIVDATRKLTAAEFQTAREGNWP